MSEPLTIESARGARKVAMAIDIAAVAASTAANIAAAPATAGGWAVAAIAPVGLFLAIVLWHRSQGILGGRLGQAFNLGLAGIAAMAAWVSYGHLRHVAEAMGQTPAVAAVIPLVVDGAAILATVVVIGAGQKIAELTEAAEAEQRAEREAARAAEQTKREAAEAARRQAEAERADAEERKTALSARQAVVAAGSTKTKTAAKPKAGKPSAAETAAAIAAYLIDHPEATAAEVGQAIGATARTVRRYSEWTGRPAAQTVEASEEVAA